MNKQDLTFIKNTWIKCPIELIIYIFDGYILSIKYKKYDELIHNMENNNYINSIY